jgi:S1/P1 Nuclease
MTNQRHSSGWSYLAAVLLFLGAPTLCFGWGQEGHRMVGDIASQFLSAQSSRQIGALLADDLDANNQPSGRKTLGEVASWPDEIRRTPKGEGTAPWHFDDMPVCGTAPKSDWCPQGNCASEQIVRLFGVLENPRASPLERNEALKWIVHLVGDIHQPLHSANHDDKGGNDIKVSFLGFAPPTLNLHSVWDVQAIAKDIQDKGLTARALAESITPEEQAAWAAGTVTDWIVESNALARTVTYQDLPGGFACSAKIDQRLDLGADYYDAAVPVIEHQLKAAGFRLAGILNAAFQAEPVANPTTLADTALISRTGAHLPDPRKTPGHATYVDAATVCSMASTKDIRNVPKSAKDRIYANYGVAVCVGYCSGPQGCEVDHLISLELGGANTEDNLWPQPYDGDWNAHDKDRLENKLKQMVCKEKTLALEQAQREISTDWVSAYVKYVGERKPFKPVTHCP